MEGRKEKGKENKFYASHVLDLCMSGKVGR